MLTVMLGSVIAGYAVGGRLRNLGRLRLRWWALAPVALAMQLVPLPSSGSARAVALGLLIASYPLLIGFAWRNLRLAGFPLIVVGLAMNLAVISFNAGMPVSCDAVRRSGQEGLCEELRREPGLKHHLAGPGDVLIPLADVIPIGPPIRQVVSAGDIVAYSGIAWLIVAAMLGRPALRPVRTSEARAPDRQAGR